MNVTSTPPKNRTVLSAFVNPASIGSNAAIAAAPGRSIRVLGAAVVSSGINSVKFLSASTDISATFAFAANGGLVLPYNDHGWVQTAEGEALNINLTAALAVGVHLLYIIV